MTYAMPPSSYRTLQPERAGRAGRTPKVWDIVLTVVFLVFTTLGAPLASYAGVFLAMASDACGGGGCDEALMNFGFWFGVIQPWAVLLVAVALSIVLLVLRRVAFWVPLTAVVLMGGLWFVAAAIVGVAVSG